MRKKVSKLDVFCSLSQPRHSWIQEILQTRTILTPHGKRASLVENISNEHVYALYSTVRNLSPELVIEIGMSVGVSTLAILAGLADNDGSGRLISIDPYSDNSGEASLKIASFNIRESGFGDRHTHIRQPSWAALPQLLLDDQKCDLVYIDGMHSFEYVLTDFFFAHLLLRNHGIVGFNDAGWYSVHRVIRFLQSNRDYRELDVGLPRRYEAASLLRSLGKWFQGRVTNDRYFRKESAFEPYSWQYFPF